MKKLALIVCALMLISMVACTTDKVKPNNNGANANNNDRADEKTLTGSAQGYGGEVTVTVKVNGDDIVSVEAVGKDETEGVGSRAIDELPDKIAEADSTDVDSVSGATKTSEAIKQAVDEALKGNK